MIKVRKCLLLLSMRPELLLLFLLLLCEDRCEVTAYPPQNAVFALAMSVIWNVGTDIFAGVGLYRNHHRQSHRRQPHGPMLS